ncbi:MAG: hypothetical protein RIS35_2954 [Pseudomonadota bacterium]
MSATADIRAFIAGRAGQTFTTSELAEHCEAEINSVYAALSVMAQRGELVRVAVGKYEVPAAAGADAADQDKADERVDAAPATDPTTTTRPAPRPARAAGKPAELEVAVYLSGSVEIARGGVRLQLEQADVRRLMAFLNRCEVAA